MSADDPIDKGKAAIVGELVQEVAASPKIREAGCQLAQAVETVSTAINVLLLPLAVINYGYAKAKRYFLEDFEADFSEKISSIPPENIIEPKASIAGPALQGLAFSHEESSLKKMYLNLLATAMDGRVSDKAHPSFVEIIRQLTSEEANLLPQYLISEKYSPVVEVRLINPGGESWLVIMPHLINFADLNTGIAIENENMSAMIENMERLGLLTVSYSTIVKHDNAYDWVENRPEIMRYRRMLEIDGKQILCVRGNIGRSAFGVQFGKAVGIV